MRDGWVTRKLGDCCEIKPPKKEARERLSPKDRVSFVPMNDLGIRAKELKFTENRALESVSGSYTYFAEGDVLLAKITPCFENGKLGIARGLTNGVGFGSSEFIVLRPNSSLDAGYLFYYLSQDCFRDAGASVMSGAVGHKRVPKEFIDNHSIPIPPLPKQKRIVAILDEAFAGIDAVTANTKKNLANARELFESYLNSVFTNPRDGWAEVQIDSACNSIVDCINKTAPKVEGPTPFKMIRTTNVRNGFVNLDSVKFVTEETYHSWVRRQVPKRGDVILTREAPLGEVGLLDTDEKVFLGQRLVSYRADPELLNNRFLLYAFQSEHVQSQIHSLASGSTVQHMRVPDSKKLKILLPALETQRQAVECLDLMRGETELLEVINQKKLTSLAELKQSLLQKAFSGELSAKATDKATDEAIT